MKRIEQTLSALRDYISDARKSGKSRLPPERVLCKQLNIPRGTLRQAYATLEAEGKIWRHVGRGTFLGTRPPVTDDQLNILTQCTNPEEVMEVRIMIEPRIAGFAAHRASASDISAMREALDKSETAVNFETFEQWDSNLHQTIAKAARNTLLTALFDSINMIRWKTEWGNLKAANLTRERRTIYEGQHRELVDAISKRNVEHAENTMRMHLETVRNDLFGSTANRTA
ncbi:MAG: FadR/GntR family transcriptional regulator [Rhodospirillales bacterium]|jgi:DNA-binding FadR family transcriptional regulator